MTGRPPINQHKFNRNKNTFFFFDSSCSGVEHSRQMAAKRPRVLNAAEEKLKHFQQTLIIGLKEINHPSTREDVRLAIGQIIFGAVRTLNKTQLIELELPTESESENSDTSGHANDDLHLKLFAKLMAGELRRMEDERRSDHIRISVTKFLWNRVELSAAKKDGHRESNSETSVQSWLAKCDPQNYVNYNN